MRRQGSAKSAAPGYIQGAIDGHVNGEFLRYESAFAHRSDARAANAPEPEWRTFCVPDHVSRDDAAKIFRRYASRHPETDDLHAYYVVQMALQDAYPCHPR